MKKRRVDIEVNVVKTLTEKDIYNMLMDLDDNELFGLTANIVSDLHRDKIEGEVPKILRESVARFLVDIIEDGDVEELYFEENE